MDIAAFIKLLPEVLKFWKWLRKDRAGEVIVRTAEVYDNMREIVDTKAYGIGRVLICYAHNGGENLAVGTKSKVTCVHEEVRPPFQNVKKEIQGLDIDGHFNDVLKECYLKKSADLHTVDMPPGILKDRYQKEKITRARLFFLKQSKKHFWYLSVATHNELVTLNEVDTKVILHRAVSNIKTRV